MKKLFSAALALIIITAAISFPGCRKTDPDPEDVTVPTEAPTEAPDPAKPPEKTPVPTPIVIPEPTEFASAETRALAESMIRRMREEHTGFHPGTDTYENCFAAMRGNVPELAEIEKADDGPLALIELLEDLIVAYSTFDLTGHYRGLINISTAPEYGKTELYAEGMAMFQDDVDIEGLLAMPPFFEKLTEAQRMRLYRDIEILWTMRNDAVGRAGGDAALKSYFDTAKLEQDVDWDPVFEP